MKYIILLFFIIFTHISFLADVNYSVTFRHINTIQLPLKPIDAVLFGNFVYVLQSNGSQGLLSIIDVTNPENVPQFITYDHIANNPVSIFLYNEYAYIIDEDNRIRVINISNPYSPGTYGSFRTLNNVNDLYAFNGYLYTAANDLGLQVYDISAPSNPHLKITKTVSGTSTGVFADSNNAYIITNNGNLTIMSAGKDLSFPIAGKFNLGYSYNDIFVKNGVAYISQGQNGIQVVDVNKPSSPKLVDNISSKRNTISVFAMGNYTWVNDELTLQVYDNTDASDHNYAGSFDNMGSKINKFVVSNDGRYVYICSDGGVLKILRADYGS